MEAQRQADRQNEEEQARAEQEAENKREEWLRSWERYAVNSLPRDVPPEVRLSVHEAVRDRLAELRPVPARDVAKVLVDAEVKRAVAGWKRDQEIAAILVECRDRRLPLSGMRSWRGDPLTEWQVQAVKAAGAAIDQVRKGAPIDEIRAVAFQAVEPINWEFELVEKAAKVFASIPRCLVMATADEREEGKRAVANALRKLSLTASEKEIEAARDAALAPLRARIGQREAEARRKNEQARRQSEAEFRVNRLGVSAVFDYLGTCENIEFSGFNDRWNTAQKVWDKIRPMLLKELLEMPNMTDQQIGKLIEKLVDQHVDKFLETGFPI